MFSKILIANRGEIAVKIIEVCKKMGIRTVAIYSTVDKEALHVKIADESYCIGPANFRDSYLNINAILTVALSTGSQAIHPGYGFLSESFEFAEKCEQNNICFIGPKSSVLKIMSNKIEMKKIMQEYEVLTIPGGCVDDKANEVKLLAENIGYPVVIKVQNGGGGRGIKKVYKKQDIENAMSDVINQGENFSRCNKIYIEKYLSPVKHIEIQICADKFGNVIILGCRDCSVQVNNQKIIEEAPFDNLDSNTKNLLFEKLINVIKESNYVGVGTLEFLMDKDNNLYFMEMNCRLQVEYFVTQLVVGLDIIKTQIDIAYGKKLKIRQEDIKFNGHAIECRVNLCSGDQKNIVEKIFVPNLENVSWHTYVYEGYKVPTFYDSLLGKLIVYSKSRLDAIKLMQIALENLKIEGIETNLEVLKKVFENKEFIENIHCTNFMGNIKMSTGKKYLSAREKLNMCVDKNSFKEYDKNMRSDNVLGFAEYDLKLRKAKEISCENESVIYGTAKINGHDVVIFVMEANFMMGTMGRVVGEKITRAFELSLKKKIPIIGVTASGGARMQEGILSLMQMAKTSAAVKKHSDEGLLYVSIITNPTLGGVSASFASLADITIVEKDAIYGFSGRRIVESTLGKKLSNDFQTAQLCQKHGMVDIVADLNQIKSILSKILKIHHKTWEV